MGAETDDEVFALTSREGEAAAPVDLAELAELARELEARRLASMTPDELRAELLGLELVGYDVAPDVMARLRAMLPSSIVGAIGLCLFVRASLPPGTYAARYRPKARGPLVLGLGRYRG